MFVVAFSEDFVAHGSSVNCLALGHKSGRVLVTGGDDKKVNLWAVGKHGCIMVCSCRCIHFYLSLNYNEETAFLFFACMMFEHNFPVEYLKL
jgi:WD40 repeat protein